MGEWSDYFEDFPEENPGNYVNGVFAPQQAKQNQVLDAKRRADQASLNAEIAKIVTDGKLRAEAKKTS
jgi:hypothetical protein